MSEQSEQVTTWANGVTLKRTRDGYTWTIAVAAEDSSLKELQAAADKAAQLDADLTGRYPDAAQRSTPRRAA